MKSLLGLETMASLSDRHVQCYILDAAWPTATLPSLHDDTAPAAAQNYAGTSPITRQSGKKKTVHARHVHNDRLLNALDNQAQSR
jgi:hypothetical protein